MLAASMDQVCRLAFDEGVPFVYFLSLLFCMGVVLLHSSC